MKNKNPEVVEIIDEREGTFKCKICSQIWFPMKKSDSKIAKSSWQCPNGCKANDQADDNNEGSNSDETKERQKANQKKTPTQKHREN